MSFRNLIDITRYYLFLLLQNLRKLLMWDLLKISLTTLGSHSHQIFQNFSRSLISNWNCLICCMKSEPMSNYLYVLSFRVSCKWKWQFYSYSTMKWFMLAMLKKWSDCTKSSLTNVCYPLVFIYLINKHWKYVFVRLLCT